MSSEHEFNIEAIMYDYGCSRSKAEVELGKIDKDELREIREEYQAKCLWR